MEDSAIGLDKWLAAIWLIANAKNGVSSWEVHRAARHYSKVGVVPVAPGPAGDADGRLSQAEWRGRGR